MRKKIISRIITFVLCFTLLFSITGCGKSAVRNSRGSSNETKEDTANGSTTKLSDNSKIVRNSLVDTSSAESVTILVYMNGSDLESEDSEATTDISEMIDASKSDNVNIVIQTMGTKSWNSKYGIASDRTQRYLVEENSLKLVDDSLSQLDLTVSQTLSDFITWGVSNYPADRYILQFWNHGGGPVYGYGYDENGDYDAALTIDEMKEALSTAGVKFDFIGMDCCIMSCLEVCCAMYDYCDYMILSEDFESGLGWSYEGWINKISSNPSIDTVTLAKTIIDDMVDANSGSDGDSATLAIIDESMIKALFTAWTSFAYANEDTLLNANYSQEVKGGNRALPMLRSDDYEDDYSISDYFITDIMAVAQNIDSDESDALSSAVSNTIKYFNKTSDETNMTGISVTLPYGDSDFYSSLKTIFTNIGMDSTYVAWLEDFVSAEGIGSDYDYDDWGDDFSWDDYDDDYDWSDWDYYDDDSYWDDDDFWGWDDYYYDDDDYYYGDDDYYYDDDDDYYYDDDDDYYYDDDDDYYYDDDDYYYDDDDYYYDDDDYYYDDDDWY